MRVFTLLLVFLACSAGSAQGQVSFDANPACFGELTAMADASTVADTSVSQWSWDFNNDGAYDDAWGKTTNHIFDAVGLVPVGLKISFNDGSADSSYQDVMINPLPQVNFYVDNLCEDDVAIFTDNSSIAFGIIDSFSWYVDGHSLGTTGPIISYNNGVSGSYVAKLECMSDQQCKSSTSKQNVVFSKPVADFSTSSSSNAGSLTYFVNSSSIVSGSVEIYLWDFGDGEGSSVETPSHEFTTAQTYTVQLVAISDQDCRDTMIKDITVDEALVPAEVFGVESTIITPNGDGFNDFLKINALADYANCKVKIYSSWNEVAFESDEYSNDEGGAFTARNVDAGAYYYIIECGGEDPLMGVINVVK